MVELKKLSKENPEILKQLKETVEFLPVTSFEITNTSDGGEIRKEEHPIVEEMLGVLDRLES